MIEFLSLVAQDSGALHESECVRFGSSFALYFTPNASGLRDRLHCGIETFQHCARSAYQLAMSS
jgi:hypothetical protein